ncbi:hypothetical protein GALL_232990 [mine drainage metagenome]|uniref:UGSC-like domain-containing protein n=1 Tax=mine drainage metagenome TaxID=410659 RepID=A0A1J5RG47_9ZZZZ
MWGSHWTMELEQKGIPGVFIVDEPFQADLQITCDKEGMSKLRRVVVPHPCGDVSDEQLPAFMPQFVTALTAALSDEERHPAAKKHETPARIAFKGTLSEVNQFFYKRGWSDGLPLIPPTEKAVAAMLKGTRHAPEEIVTKNMLPESMTVTVENVATVAVMAGCEPKYLPLLLSIIEAFDNDWFSSTVRSTTSFSFAILVNGPGAKKLGMNAGINALGSGTENKANATIGRFLRLAIICLGGSRSRVNDMSSIGNPSKYSFAFAENEERSPWEPYHVSSGYSADQNVVTVMTGGWSHNSPFGKIEHDVVRGLDSIARTIANYELPNGCLLLMDPMAARKIAAQGYTKQATEEYIWSRATRTLADFQADAFYSWFIEPVLKGKEWYGRKALWPASYLDLGPDDEVQIFPAGSVRIVVVGGETNTFTQSWQLARPSSVVIDKWK